MEGINVGLSEVQGGVGNTTQFVFQEKPAFKAAVGNNVSPIIVETNGDVSGGDFPKFQGTPSAVDLALLGNLIDPGVFTGTRTRADGYPGQLRGQGGVVLGGSALLGPSIIRMLLQDKNPSYHILGGTGKTLPAAVDVVDAQALPGTAAKTIAENLSSTKNPVRLTVTPKAGTASRVNIVDGQDLTGDEPKTIAQDLSDYDTPFALRVAPSNTSTLTDDQTPATIVIKGIDAQDRLQTVTLEFPDASKTTRQETTQTFKLVTEVTATNWATGTVTISIGLSGTLGLGEGVEFARVKIVGKDQNGNSFSDPLVFADDNKADAQTTTRYFTEITEVTASGWSGGALDITAQDKAVRVTIKPQDEKIVCFWRGELTRGIIPEVIDDMLMQQLTININADDVMRYASVFVFRDSFHQMNLAGDTGELARKSDASALTFPVDDFFIGWQAEVSIDGIPLAITDANLVINQQFAPSGVISGEQTDEGIPTGGTRNVTLTANIKYATQNDFNKSFRGNVKFTNIQVRFFNKLLGGFPAQLRFRGGRGELNANPVPTYTDAGDISQSLVLNLLPTKVGALDDIVAIIDVPEYMPGLIYN